MTYLINRRRLARTICVVLHGAALGRGFELALACEYRIAVDDAAPLRPPRSVK
jgi:enoyl-CoA hydratase/carnithine racemase